MDGVRQIVVRTARIDDAQAITDIYNHYIRETTVTFHTELLEVQDRREWLSGRSPEHPVMVVESQGTVVAWGALSPWSERGAWRRTVEIAVYVAPTERGRGIGPQLTDRLLTEARSAGHHVVISQVVADNAASISMVERAGFEKVGRLREVGWKFGRWLDVDLYERILAD